MTKVIYLVVLIMFIEDMLVNRNSISLLLLIVTLVILLIAFFLNSEYVFIQKAKDYELKNEIGKEIPSDVYTLTRGGSERLYIILFNGSKEINICVVPNEKLIGLTQGSHPVILFFNNYGLLKRSALEFTPLNEGFNKEIIECSFNKKIIKFNTFQMTKFLGDEIIIIKK